MNTKQHKRRHQTLHKALAELYADFVKRPEYTGDITRITVVELIAWSDRQQTDPDHDGAHNGGK